MSSLEPTQSSLSSYKDLPKIPKLGPKDKPKRVPLVVAPGLAFGSPETCTPAVTADLAAGSTGLMRKQKTIEVETSSIDKTLQSEQNSINQLSIGKANTSNGTIQDETQPSTSSKPAAVQPGKILVMKTKTVDPSHKVIETSKWGELLKKKETKEPQLDKITLETSKIHSKDPHQLDGEKLNQKTSSPPLAGDSVIHSSVPKKVNIDSRVPKDNKEAKAFVQNPMRVSEKFRGTHPTPPTNDILEAPAYEAVMFLLNNFPPEDSISDAICQWTAKIIQEEKILIANRNRSNVTDRPTLKKGLGLTK